MIKQRSGKLEKLVNAAKFIGKLTFVTAYTGIFLYIGYAANDIIEGRTLSEKPLFESYSYKYIEIYKDKIIKHSEEHEELPPALFKYKLEKNQQKKQQPKQKSDRYKI